MAEEIATHVRQSPSGPIEKLPGGGSGGGAVDSVFGRAGVVVAEPGDYDAGQVSNDSGVGGANVAEALDALDFDIVALQQALATLGLSAVLDNGDRVLFGQRVAFEPISGSQLTDAAIVVDETVLSIIAPNPADGAAGALEGGSIRILGGNGLEDGQGGFVSIAAGNGGFSPIGVSNGGSLVLRGGDSYGDGGLGGNVEISGGFPNSLSFGNGGTVTVYSPYGRVIIQDLVDPSSPQDAATKAYVDANAGGGGGDTPTLAEVLTAGSSTGSTHIIFEEGIAALFANGVGSILAQGFDLQIRAVDRNQFSFDPGGSISIVAGRGSLDAGGGDVTIAGGDGQGSGPLSPAGGLNLRGGYGAGGNFGGNVNIQGGGADDVTKEGSVYIKTAGGPAARVFLWNLAEPSAPDDAATKAYVDAHAGGGGGVPDTIGPNGSENVTLDMVPTTQAQGTINTGASVNFDAPITVGRRYSLTADVWVEDGATDCVYTKNVTAVVHRKASGDPLLIAQALAYEFSLAPGFTFTASVPAGLGVLRYTLTNTSGTARPYNLLLGRMSADKP